MKSLIVFSLTSLIAAVSFAKQSDIVCESYKQPVKTQIVVADSGDGKYAVSVYRSINGRSGLVDKYPATQLNGSRGPILAYGDVDQNKVLILNLHNRDQNSLVLGTYQNTKTSEDVLDVKCKL